MERAETYFLLEPPRHLIRIVLLASAYYALGKIGLGTNSVDGSAALFWPPAGVALAALILGGLDLWPAVFIGATAISLSFSSSLLPAVGIGIGNTLEAGACLYLLKCLKFQPALNRGRDALILIGAATVASMVGASIGVACLWLGNCAHGSSVIQSWVSWWLGDLTSFLVITPFLLAWMQPLSSLSRQRVAEALILTLLVVVDAWIIFSRFNDLTQNVQLLRLYLLLPLLGWATLRFGARGASASVMFLSVAGIAVLRHDAQDLMLLQTLSAVCALTGLTVSTYAAELKHLNTELRVSRADLERREAELAAVFELSGVGQAQVDPRTNKYLRVNRKFAQMLGRSPRDLLRRTVFEVTHPCDRAEDAKALQTLLTGEADEYSREKRYIRPDGSEVWTEVTAVLLRNSDGTPARTTGVVRDITKRKLDQRRLLEAKDFAERACRAKDWFVAAISHEIRTPLASILGFADLLLSQRITDEEHLRFVQTIKRNGEVLSRVINDILDLSKVEAGHLGIDLGRICLPTLLEEVAACIKVLASSKNVTVSWSVAEDLPKCITTDAIRLKQILMNVVGNAVKFTCVGEVQVALSIEERPEGPALHVDVKDTGLGLTPEQAARLFKPFSQAELGTERRYGGTGLGLVLARHIARALGGDLWLQKSVLGVGSTFSLRVALRREDFKV